jgi:hypothetical protein
MNGSPAERTRPGPGTTEVVSCPDLARTARPLAEVVLTFRVSNRRR